MSSLDPSKSVFVPRFSNTSGDQWVRLGEFATLREAQHELKGYRKAGNLTQIIEVFPAGVAQLRTFDQLIADGLARCVE